MQIAGLAAWAASHPETIPVHCGKALYMNDPELVDTGAIRCFGALAAVTAMAYCHQRSRAFIPAEGDKSIPENMLLMMGFVDKVTTRPDPAVIRHLDKLWILYADHEMTASTAAFLHVAATGADPLSCGVAALAAAAGPYHGGAIDMAYKRFEKLGTAANVKHMIDEVKAKKYRLPGVGHRLYRTEDPRGKFLRQLLEQFKGRAQSDPLLAIALEIDRVVREDDYFTSRKLSINADLYGCLVYTAL
jgi:citrate synthase